MRKNHYEINATMRLLGKQCATDVFWRNNKARKAIDEIAEARPYSFTLEAASNIFVLGYIFGKRAERARKNGTVSRQTSDAV